MASSSSARKVAKLASRGRGKKVRFSGGTTFPTALTVVILLMVALIVYAKVSIPSAEKGHPEVGETWVAAYSLRVCDTEFKLTGTPDELGEDASTGNPDKLAAGELSQDDDGIIHYHPQVGGNSGRKARLGVFLDVYDVELSPSQLEVPQAQVGDGATEVWHEGILKSDEFKGTDCFGKNAVIKVRVWDDYTSGGFQDFTADFDSLRIDRNGKVFVIAIVPDDSDFSIPRPDWTCDLENWGAIGSGDLCGSGSDATSPATSEPTDSSVPVTTATTDDSATTTAAPTTTG